MVWAMASKCDRPLRRPVPITEWSVLPFVGTRDQVETTQVSHRTNRDGTCLSRNSDGAVSKLRQQARFSLVSTLTPVGFHTSPNRTQQRFLWKPPGIAERRQSSRRCDTSCKAWPICGFGPNLVPSAFGMAYNLHIISQIPIHNKVCKTATRGIDPRLHLHLVTLRVGRDAVDFDDVSVLCTVPVATILQDRVLAALTAVTCVP